MQAGTIDGLGTLTFASFSEFAWMGGKFIGSGHSGNPVNLEANATLNINGTAVKTLDGGTINNDGRVVWEGTGNILAENGAWFNNRPGSTFEAKNPNNQTVKFGDVGNQDDTWCTLSGSTYTQSTNCTVEFACTVQNAGTFNIAAGTVRLIWGLKGGLGAFVVSTGANLELEPESATWHELLGTFSGGGLTRIWRAMDLQPGTTTFQNVQLIRTIIGEVEIGGSGNFVLAPGGHLKLNGMTLGGTGTAELGPNSTTEFDIFGFILDRDLTNKGTIILNQSELEIRSGVLTNQGLVDIQGNQTVTRGDGPGPFGGFSNQGTVRLGGANVIARFEVQVGNNHIWDVNGGTLEIEGPEIFTPGIPNNAGGEIRLNGGTIKTPGIVWLKPDSVMKGAGTIEAFVLWNEGTITVSEMGGPRGTLTVKGDYKQFETGVLNLKIAGRPAAGKFDRLVIQAGQFFGGHANLRGTLNVAKDGAAPLVQNDVYDMISWLSITNAPENAFEHENTPQGTTGSYDYPNKKYQVKVD
jgi:hypothetical protein